MLIKLAYTQWPDGYVAAFPLFSLGDASGVFDTDFPLWKCLTHH